MTQALRYIEGYGFALGDHALDLDGAGPLTGSKQRLLDGWTAMCERIAHLERQLQGPEHDYPTESELEHIETWPLERGFPALMDYVLDRWWPDSSLWQRRECFERERPATFYVLHTGGWSGNEDMIGAMMRNSLFWMSCYVASSRGGHYVFEAPCRAE